MPSSDSPALIVARFLKANHYTQTLEAFLQEAGISPDAVTLSSGDWTIEKILQEKKQFDASLAYEKKGNAEQHGWTEPSPSVAQTPALPSTSNVLYVMGDVSVDSILTTHADRKLNVTSSIPPYNVVKTIGDNDSPILSIYRLDESHYLTTSMSGELTLRQTSNHRLVSSVRHHAKYAVASTSIQLDTSSSPPHLIATAGWDQKVNFYSLGSSESKLTVPFYSISLPTVPESLLFAHQPATSTPYLILSRRDSTFLYYYAIHTPPNTTSSSNITVTPAGRQNLAPHSNAWISFTPSHFATHPSDPTLLAVATSSLPHMKLIIVRLLFPGATPDNLPTSTPQPSGNMPISFSPNPATASSRAALETASREEAAIALHISTLAPQTPYSTPRVVWRPDGSGVYVNGDDGVIRGVDVSKGKVVALLKGEGENGHEVGSKVRTLWCGYLSGADGKGQGRREVLLSGGFDKRVVIWECPDNGDP